MADCGLTISHLRRKKDEVGLGLNIYLATSLPFFKYPNQTT